MINACKNISMSKAFSFILIMLLAGTTACEIMPRNTLKDCRMQCGESRKSKACYDFCDCIHVQGQPLDSCLDKYDKAPPDINQTSK